MPDVTIGQLLRDEQLRREISESAAGETLGVSQQTFGRWAVGANVPTSQHWTAIARFVKVPRDEVARLCREAKLGGSDSSTAVAKRLGALEEDVAEVKDLLRQLLDQRRARRG